MADIGGEVEVEVRGGKQSLVGREFIDANWKARKPWHVNGREGATLCFLASLHGLSNVDRNEV